jgi:hypothetical protein
MPNTTYRENDVLASFLAFAAIFFAELPSQPKVCWAGWL